MRILIADCTVDPDSWGCADLRRLARVAIGADLEVRRAPKEDLPADPSRYDRIIVSGSSTAALADAPWIEKLHQFIRRSVDLRKPFLGVCYGHQTLVRALGGKQTVRRAEEGEFGWTKIERSVKTPLFEGLPDSFYSFSSHFDEVAELPGVLQNLARSEACAVQAVRVRELPVFGIQFHPEKDAKDAEKAFAWRRKQGSPARLLHPRESGKYYDVKVGETIFRNFLTAAQGSGQ